jgi:hypothetical protein
MYVSLSAERKIVMSDEAVLQKLDQLTNIVIAMYRQQQKNDLCMHLTAKALLHQLKTGGILPDIRDAEFKVYSQFGDDGIIQYLVMNIDIPESSRTFVEFGVENYLEANTRFLLYNNNWSGYVMDGSLENIQFIRQDTVLNWRHHITAKAAFITSENINDLIKQGGYAGEIGILSVDIDGNDYWVLKNIDIVSPIIIIAEYNSVFGKNHAVTIPYDPSFTRSRAHHSCLYMGCSLKALCLLAQQKGYEFVGSNSQGINAYFVRKDKLGSIPPVSPESGYVRSQIRESKDEQGRLTFVSGIERLRLIENMAVYDIERDVTAPIKELYADELGYA